MDQTQGPKAIRIDRKFANDSKALAANQGLYNGFLAAGLVWSLAHPDPLIAHQLQLFFLGCVIVAALYGGATVKHAILFIQGIPACIALACIFLVQR